MICRTPSALYHGFSDAFSRVYCGVEGAIFPLRPHSGDICLWSDQLAVDDTASCPPKRQVNTSPSGTRVRYCLHRGGGVFMVHHPWLVEWARGFGFFMYVAFIYRHLQFFPTSCEAQREKCRPHVGSATQCFRKWLLTCNALFLN